MAEKIKIPRGWSLVRLGEIFDFVGGGTPSKKNSDYWNGNVNWASVKDIKSRYLIKTEDTISEIGLRNSSANIAEAGDVILITRINPGKSSISKIRTAINQDLKIIKPKYEALSEFVQYLFSSIEKKCIGLSSGTTVLGVSLTNLNEIEFLFPPLPEQHRIVAKIEELFSSLDKGIESLKSAQQQLKVYRQAVLKWAFEGRLTHNTKIAYVNLGDLCDSVEYGSAAKSKELGKIPVLRMGNIQGGKFDWTDLVYTDDDQEIRKYSLQKDDVLFNRTNSPELVGKTAIYKGERAAIFAGYLIRVNYDKTKILPDYLNYYLNSHEAKTYGNSVMSFGVNQANINGTKLRGYPIPFTDKKEQRKIVSEIESRLSLCDKIEETIIQSLQQAEALRQSILKKAFEGKLVPQDPSDEPASVLLERIREISRNLNPSSGKKKSNGKPD